MKRAPKNGKPPRTERESVDQEMLGSEARLRSLFRAAPVGIGLVINRVIMEANELLCRMTGYTKEELIGQSARLLYPSDGDFDFVGTEKYRQIANRGTGSVETRWQRKDGTVIEVLLSSVPLDPSDLSIGVTFTALDITDRKRMESELRSSHEQMRIAQAAANAGLWDWDMLTGRLDWSEQFFTLLGLSPATEPSFDTWLKVVHPEDREPAMKKIQKAIDEHVRLENEYRITRSDGEERWIAALGDTFYNDTGKPERMVGICIDITERKRAEEELRASENKFSIAFANNPAAIAIARLHDGQLLEVNDTWLELHGYTREEVEDKSVREMGVWPTKEALTRLMKELKEKGSVNGWEQEFHKKSGEVFVAQLSSQVLTVHGEKLILTTLLDITERKRAEERILREKKLQEGINRILHEAITAETEERLGLACLAVIEELTESKIGFIGELGRNGALYDICISNPGWASCEMYDKTGHRRSLGQFKIEGLYGHVLQHGKSLLTNRPADHPDSVGLPEGHPPLTAFLGVPLIEQGKTMGLVAVGNRDGGYEDEHRRTLESLAPAVVEALLRKRAEDELRRSRDELELRVRARTHDLEKAYQKLLEEIQQRNALEDQLRQAHKMEAIGTLAGGIAHDFNNILASIIGFTEMAIEDVPDRPLVERNLKNVMTSATRARDLVKQILAFSRKTKYERSPVALSPIVKETVKFLRASIPATVDVTLSATTTSATVTAAPVEVQQIVMNLATNALFAMEDQKGSLVIAVSDIDFEPDAFAPDQTSREYLQIMVKDTGVGMTPEVMKRIFDPFFTTREVGKGSGMGLAVVYGIVKDLKGTITVESEPGRGSIFRVFLPKAEEKAQEETQQAPLPRGDERVLFVDDEPLLVEWGRQTLEKLGYTVTAVRDARQALEVFIADPSLFDLVITDQAMPQTPGSDLCAELLRIRSDTPIILCTGHSETVSPERAEKIGIREFLTKPLTRQELASAIRRVLDKDEDQ